MLKTVTVYRSKKRPKTNLKLFSFQTSTQRKDQKSSYQVKQILANFYNLIALILGQNSVKGHTVTNIVKNFKFERVWGELEPKKCF